MNRRKFLKFLGYAPLAFLIPKIVIAKISKPIDSNNADMYGFVNFVNKTGDGGYMVPKHIATKLQEDLFKDGFQIPMH